MLIKNVTIITGASQNHFRSLMQFLSTVDFNQFDCIVYDLGLDNCNILTQAYPRIHYFKFDYSKYPSYYDVTINAGEYAWKPAIINEVLSYIKSNNLPTEILIWCDAGDKIINKSLSQLIPVVYNNKIYSPISSGTIRQWTHSGTTDCMNIDRESLMLNNINRNGAILCFNIVDPRVCSFIKDFSYLASVKDCIAPEGSSRLNHRQDQSIFSIMYYIFMYNNSELMIHDNYFDISIHNDCD